MNNKLVQISLALAIIVSSIVLSNAFLNRNQEEDKIWVKGLGKTNFTSDLVVWRGSFTRIAIDLKTAYQELNKDRKLLEDYLLEQGIDPKDLVFEAVNINKDYRYDYDNHGNSRQVFVGYRLRQSISVSSQSVELIETVARDVTDLIHQGIEFHSEPPQYYYTGLSDLKIEMIATATEDGFIRAEQIASKSGASLGELKSARMGVFQIIGQNSNENFSWGGAFNTHSKQKTATITMTLEYGID